MTVLLGRWLVRFLKVGNGVLVICTTGTWAGSAKLTGATEGTGGTKLDVIHIFGLSCCWIIG